MINELDLEKLKNQFHSADPFDHVVIDDFWKEDIAEQLYRDFPDYDDNQIWGAYYNNRIENKKTCNHWDKFPKTTYQAFRFLASEQFQTKLRFITDEQDLNLDIGLHGGGWHAHTKGGNLNIHLDYNVHPKLDLQRKLNIIIYLSKDWNYGGGLELWTHDPETNQPKAQATVVDIKFNRAVIFDTTQNSWHGLPYPIQCPQGAVRKSMAAYYLKTKPSQTEDRPRALFAPRPDQVNDQEIAELIKRRSR